MPLNICTGLRDWSLNTDRGNRGESRGGGGGGRVSGFFKDILGIYILLKGGSPVFYQQKVMHINYISLHSTF